MADDEVATRAPESDAAEGSMFSGDTKAQEGASMGEHCVTDRPTPSGEKPTGEISKLGDVDVYITKPSDYPHSPCKLLLLLTGGTGIHSTNNQLQADAYACEGFLVIMPDQFGGDAAPNSASATVNTAEDPNPSFIEQVKLRAAETAKSFMIDMWLARHTPTTVLPILHHVLDAAKDEFADAVANGGGVYAAGYCFGAKYVLLLAGTHPHTDLPTTKPTHHDIESNASESSTHPLIRAAAIAHGTSITRDDIAAVRAPVSMVCVTDDLLFPDEVREAGAKSLGENKVEHEIRLYEGVPHGFAVVGEYGDEGIRGKQGEAFGQMLGWLKGH